MTPDELTAEWELLMTQLIELLSLVNPEDEETERWVILYKKLYQRKFITTSNLLISQN